MGEGKVRGRVGSTEGHTVEVSFPPCPQPPRALPQDTITDISFLCIFSENIYQYKQIPVFIPPPFFFCFVVSLFIFIYLFSRNFLFFIFLKF